MHHNKHGDCGMPAVLSSCHPVVVIELCKSDRVIAVTKSRDAVIPVSSVECLGSTGLCCCCCYSYNEHSRKMGHRDVIQQERLSMHRPTRHGDSDETVTGGSS